MTVTELIAALREYPPSMEVFVEGYESGYNPADKMGIEMLRKVAGPAWYDGKYESVDKGDEACDDEQALIFYR
jgi:hypothetical protein